MDNEAFSDILQTILDLVQKLIAKDPSKYFAPLLGLMLTITIICTELP